MKEFISTLYSSDYNGSKEDERDDSSSDEEINLLINESSEESQSDSELAIQTRKTRKAPLISESSEEIQTDSEVVNPKRKKKPPLIYKTPKLESDREVVNPTRKRKLFALSTDEIINAVLEIGKLCQSHGVKDIFISSLICRKNNFQNNKVSMINKLLRRACDSLGFHFIYNSSIARNHLAGDGIHLNYAGTEVLLENIAFCLNNFL